MATYEKRKLSADSTGDGIWLNTSASPILVHSTGTSATVIDELWLYVSNIDSTNTATVSIDFGLTGQVEYVLPARSGLTLLVPGLVFSGTGSAATDIYVTDDSSSGNCFVLGYVNRITP